MLCDVFNSFAFIVIFFLVSELNCSHHSVELNEWMLSLFVFQLIYDFDYPLIFDAVQFS